MKTERLTALKVRLADVSNGRFVQGSKEDLRPSYIIDGFGRKISRVNVIAAVTEKFVSSDKSFVSITLDDGTGALRVKAFGDDPGMFDSIETGDEVMVAGRVREYSGETYIVPEVARRIEDINQETLRRLEVLKGLIVMNRARKSIKKLAEIEGAESARRYATEDLGIDTESADFMLGLEKQEGVENREESVLRVLRELDKGEGVDIGRILEESRLSEQEVESAVTKLLDDGDIFEPHAGKFKIVG